MASPPRAPPQVFALQCQCLAALAQDKPDDACAPAECTAARACLALPFRVRRSALSSRHAPPLSPNSYQPLVNGVLAFVRDFRTSEEAWGVAPLAALARSLRVVSFAGSPAKEEARLSDVGRHLMTCFSAALQGSGNRAKRGATLPIVNQLFRVYFRINTLPMCKNLIRSLEAPNAMPLESFPIGQRVTYRFYTGRLAVFNEDFTKADGA